MLTDADWRNAAFTSLRIAAIVTPISLILGTLAALGLDRGPMRGRNFVYALLISPMILPHIVLGLGIFRIALQLNIDDSLLAIVPAHLTITIPFVVISVGASLQSFDESLEKAARNLGATPLQALWHVTLPIIRPGLVGGGIFAFIMSFDEFIITYFLAVQTRTLPLDIFASLRYQVSPSIAAVSTLTIAVSAALTVALLLRGQVMAGERIVR
ncbi:MAG: ABC transporter permease [Verrucomicrobia bacterium]|nr:ABC transporter permease [Verrucomicrobiota bacterium]